MTEKQNEIQLRPGDCYRRSAILDRRQSGNNEAISRALYAEAKLFNNPEMSSALESIAWTRHCLAQHYESLAEDDTWIADILDAAETDAPTPENDAKVDG